MLGGRKLKIDFSDKKPRQNRQEKHHVKEKKIQVPDDEDEGNDDENNNTDARGRVCFDQNAHHLLSILMSLSCSSMVRASSQYLEGHGFDSYQGL